MLKAPLTLIEKGAKQAAMAKINPNNAKFKVIFANPLADAFLRSLGYAKAYSSTYEYQEAQWEDKVDLVKNVIARIKEVMN